MNTCCICCFKLYRGKQLICINEYNYIKLYQIGSTNIIVSSVYVTCVFTLYQVYKWIIISSVFAPCAFSLYRCIWVYLQLIINLYQYNQEYFVLSVHLSCVVYSFIIWLIRYHIFLLFSMRPIENLGVKSKTKWLKRVVSTISHVLWLILYEHIKLSLILCWHNSNSSKFNWIFFNNLQSSYWSNSKSNDWR